MSEMSFKQAKEIVQHLELSEISLKKTLTYVHKSTNNLNLSLVKQQELLDAVPKAEKKVNTLKLVLVLNVGFILGLIAGKFLF
ncbi:MAG: hypothetical protein COA66_11005 [Arcobacter sp.]|nr:MAG: hypothetical protein COA66_11005 [Arcobacter sp.]